MPTYSIETHNEKPAAVVDAPSPYDALVAAARGLGGGLVHYSGSFTPSLLGAPGFDGALHAHKIEAE